jgi:hypothetical protein
MNSNFDGSNQVANDHCKEETDAPLSQNISEPAQEGSDIPDRACATTWSIYHECGDPSAIWLFKQIKEQCGERDEISHRLKQALPGWCRANKTRAELCTLLSAQFSHQPETEQAAVDEIGLRIKERCINFACTQYDDTAVAREFGAVLSKVAWGELDIPQRPIAQAAFAILRERENSLEKRRKDQAQLDLLLKRHKVSPKLQMAIAIDTSKGQKEDPILDLLRQFFAVKNCYWRNFFDKHGRLRKKKLPNFPTMRKRLVDALLAPDRPGEPPNGEEFNARKARELAAICLKAAYPGMFPESLDGESVRLILQYHEQMESRSVSVVRR